MSSPTVRRLALEQAVIYLSGRSLRFAPKIIINYALEFEAYLLGERDRPIVSDDAPPSEPSQCPAMLHNLRCDLEEGHAGTHQTYDAEGPLFFIDDIDLDNNQTGETTT